MQRAYEEERRTPRRWPRSTGPRRLFFSNVSHEFRTPLTLMLAPMEEALGRSRASDASGAARAPGDAHRNSLRLLKLVNTLLDFSRIEAGRAQAQFEARPTWRCSQRNSPAFSASAMDRAGVGIRGELPPLAGPVHVDRDMWEKIVLNLLSNAFKFTFDGEIAVTMQHMSRECVELAVARYRDRDPGPRSSRISSSVFTAFKGSAGADPRGHGHRTGAGAGAGELHGGTFGVVSREGSGTEFKVNIPIGSSLSTSNLARHRRRAYANYRACLSRGGHEVASGSEWLFQFDGSFGAAGNLPRGAKAHSGGGRQCRHARLHPAMLPTTISWRWSPTGKQLLTPSAPSARSRHIGYHDAGARRRQSPARDPGGL